MPEAGPSILGSELWNMVSRIERLADEKDLLGRKIADVYSEAKAKGYDKKALHQVIRLRAQDPAERQEQEALVTSYMESVAHAEQEGAAALSEQIPWPTRQRLMAGR